MQSQASRPAKTFTIGFHESGYNEAVDAKAVARHLGTDHAEWYVTPREAMEVVPKLPSLYDEPFADSSQIPTFLVSQLARRHVTVSLSGDGGDELFGGYTRYARMLRLWRRLSLLPKPLRRIITDTVGAIRPDDGSRRKLHKLAALASAQDPVALYLAFTRLWHGGAALVRDIPPFPAMPAQTWPHCGDMLHQLMGIDTVTYLPDDILAKVDRASMGVSLESRIPLLDPRVVEFAWRLPRRMKIRGNQTKWILRQILYKHVPRSLVERPKAGFGVPVAEWLRGPLREWAEDLLDASRIQQQGYLAVEPVRRRWREHLSKTYDHSGVLWGVLMFQAWLEAERSCAETRTLPAQARVAAMSEGVLNPV
jgi:asparagine synthase (glutamine-hydrolysing)